MTIHLFVMMWRRERVLEWFMCQKAGFKDLVQGYEERSDGGGFQNASSSE